MPSASPVVDVRIRDMASTLHSTEGQFGITTDQLAQSRTQYPPDGTTEGAISITVTDDHGTPAPGQRVRFELTYVQPKGLWRTPAGLRELYDDTGGDGAKAEKLAKNGTIRLLGTLTPSIVTTDRDGVATATYRTSHIASDLSQQDRGKEKVTAQLDNGYTRSLRLKIGWTGLRRITDVAGGLRVIGATGTYVHPQLHKFLQNLGNQIVQRQWPHAVTVTAASLRWGGQYPPHFSHKHGLTLDLRPMSTDGNPTWAKRDGTAHVNYDKVRTQELIRDLKSSGGRVFFNGVRLFCVGGPEGARRGCERHGESYLTRRRRGEAGDGGGSLTGGAIPSA